MHDEAGVTFSVGFCHHQQGTRSLKDLQDLWRGVYIFMVAHTSP